jgi:hypothetical protein
MNPGMTVAYFATATFPPGQVEHEGTRRFFLVNLVSFVDRFTLRPRARWRWLMNLVEIRLPSRQVWRRAKILQREEIVADDIALLFAIKVAKLFVLVPKALERDIVRLTDIRVNAGGRAQCFKEIPYAEMLILPLVSQFVHRPREVAHV